MQRPRALRGERIHRIGSRFNPLEGLGVLWFKATSPNELGRQSREVERYMSEKLNDESIRGWMRERTGWKRRNKTLIKEFRFPSFRDSIVFVNRVASLADDLDHHPDIDIRYTTVILTLTTHETKGLSVKDLELAEKVDFATSAR